MGKRRCNRTHVFDLGGLTWGKFNNENGSLTGAGKGAIGSIIGSGLSGMLTGGNQSKVGNFMVGAGKVASMIPGPYGQMVSAGLQTAGNVTNALWGSNINEQFIKDKNSELTDAMGNTSQANNSQDFISDFSNMKSIGSFSQEDVGTQGIFSHAAEDEYNRLKAAAAVALDTQRGNYNNQGWNINQQAMLDNLLALKAFGGNLSTQGADFSNGLVFVDEGGTHGENPYNGVPMGVSPDGMPNLVEEGEVVKKGKNNQSYVFSNRLKVSKDMIGKYKLPKNITYAKAVKKLSRESEERPNDPISKNGLDAIIQDLTNSQEEVRMRKRQRLEPVMAAYGGRLFDDGGGIIYDGGPSNKYTGGLRYIEGSGWAYIDQNGTVRGYGYKNPWEAMRAAGLSPIYNSPSRLNKDIRYFGKKPLTPQTDDPILARIYAGTNNYVPAGSSPASASTFETDGVFDENGNLITAGTTGTSEGSKNAKGSIKGKASSRKKAAAEQGIPSDLSGLETWDYMPNPYLDAINGNLYNPVEPDSTQEAKILTGAELAQRRMETLPNNGEGYNQNYDAVYKDYVNRDNPDDLQTWTRYAPVFGNLLGLSYNLLNGPDESLANELSAAAKPLRNYNRISWRPVGTELKLTPYDINYAANQILSAGKGANSYARNFSNGNVGAAMNNILTGTYNTQLGLGNAYRQGIEMNNANNKTIADFYLNRDLANSQGFLNADARNQAADINSRGQYFTAASQAARIRQAAKDAHDASISANATALFNNLGAIGNENWDRNYRNWLIRSRVFGEQNEKPQDWSDERWAAYKKNKGIVAACGGKIKSRKKGLTY